MNKSELVEAIAKKTDASNASVERMVNAFIETVTTSLSKGQSVQLVGFGSFNITKRKARAGRNPRTGAAIKIAASKVPRFSPGARLKAAVNNKKS
jgi:DNA-binding protein HU-beta